MCIEWGNFFTTLSATAIGALIAIVVSIIIESKRQDKANETELINYFYNLNTALRNISHFVYNLETVKKIYNDNGLLMVLPISTINFNFNESKLSFVQPFNYVFFENINQIKIELNMLYELGMSYKEKPDSQMLNEISHSTVTISNQIVMTMKNINNFLKTYMEKETLIDNQCTENFNQVDIYTADFKKLIILESQQNNNDMTFVEKFEQEIHSIKTGWKIEFTRLPWYKKILKKLIGGSRK